MPVSKLLTLLTLTLFGQHREVWVSTLRPTHPENRDHYALMLLPNITICSLPHTSPAVRRMASFPVEMLGIESGLEVPSVLYGWLSSATLFFSARIAMSLRQNPQGAGASLQLAVNLPKLKVKF